MGSSTSHLTDPIGFRTASTASLEAVQKSQAMVDAYEARSHYSLPKTPMKPKKIRDSGTCPQRVAYLLDGGPSGDYAAEESESEEAFLNVRFACFWGYYAAIITLFFITIILVIISFYFEMVAYLADREWNRVLEGSSVFPHVVKGDAYFAGKTFFQSHPVDPLPEDYLKKVLKRHHGLEFAVLVLIVVFLLGAIAHPIALCYWALVKKQKMRFQATKFGILGIILFVAATFLVMAMMVKIPNRFIRLRIILEDKVGVISPEHFDNKEPHGHDAHHIVDSCTVAVNSDTNKNYQKLSQLLLVMKMCAYRYVEMNRRDPCRNIPIPSHLLLNKKDYSVDDFKELGICSNDKHKLTAALLNIICGILCWIIMGLGSHLKIRMKAKLLQFKIRKTLLIDTSEDAKAGNAPDDGRRNARRDAVPRQAQPQFDVNAEAEAQKNTNEIVEFKDPEDPEDSFLPPFPMFRTTSSTGSSMLVTKKSQTQGDKKPFPADQRQPAPGSSVHTNSVMTLAPKFVIHPTVRQTSNIKKRRNSIWFSYS